MQHSHYCRSTLYKPALPVVCAVYGVSLVKSGYNSRCYAETKLPCFVIQNGALKMEFIMRIMQTFVLIYHACLHSQNHYADPFDSSAPRGGYPRHIPRVNPITRHAPRSRNKTLSALGDSTTAGVTRAPPTWVQLVASHSLDLLPMFQPRSPGIGRPHCMSR